MSISLAGSKTVNGHPDGMIGVLLNGLVGEIEGKKYEGTMVSMATNNDAWVASVISYVRNSFGNHAGKRVPEPLCRPLGCGRLCGCVRRAALRSRH